MRWLLDPDDDVACVRALTAAHDLEAGRIVCHTVPGASWPVLVRDLLCALGKDRDALARDRRVRDGPALLAVWLRAEDVEHVRHDHDVVVDSCRDHLHFVQHSLTSCAVSR